MKVRIPPAVVRRAGPPALRALCRSWRFRFEHAERAEPVRARARPHVILCWHEVMLPLLWAHRGWGLTVIASTARDGRYAAEFAMGLGYAVVDGSSTRGGARALRGALAALAAGGSVCVTPDGPQGPRRVLKGEAVALAQRSGAALLPVHARAARAWRARSWDRFLLPKPWTAVTITYGAPIEVAPGEAGRLAAGRAAGAALAAMEDAA